MGLWWHPGVSLVGEAYVMKPLQDRACHDISRGMMCILSSNTVQPTVVRTMMQHDAAQCGHRLSASSVGQDRLAKRIRLVRECAHCWCGCPLIQICSHENLHMLIVRVSGVVALKSCVLVEVVAPIMPTVRIAAVLKVYELHASKSANCSPVLHFLQDPMPCYC